MIELTLIKTNNEKVYVNANMIVSIEPVSDDATMVYLLGGSNPLYYTVTETPQEIMRLIAKVKEK